MPIIQEAIHKIEVAGGRRYLRIGLALLAVVGAMVFYNFKCFRNLSTQEAMDSAQLARNISHGKGYTTYFIRPFSMFLLRKHNEQRGVPPGSRLSDLTQIRKLHPDIANPPVYPVALAAMMKILPFKYAVAEKSVRYEPESLIGMFNELLFFALIVVVFFLARRLFDIQTAWLSAALLFGADILWRFSISGLSTILLMLIFCGLVWCMVLLEENARELKRSLISSIVLALFAGLLLGMGALTRYSFIWLAIPCVLYLLIFGGAQRIITTPIMTVAFLAVLLPWIIRNFHVSGTPFGTAGYFAYDGTALFPENQLERSLQPEMPSFNTLWLTVLIQKFLINTRHIFQDDLLHLGGGFVGVFFIVGVLIALSNPAASRMRYFLIGSLLLLVVVQAFGRTHLSNDSPDINSENLLILTAPLVIIYGVQFFWALLNQIYLPIRELRYVVIGLFCLITCLPMLFNFLPPRTSALAYPPYLPPYIQSAAGYVKEDELTMCDIPWAMAWYGNVPSVWTTQTADGFIEVDSLQKPIKELYLSSATLNGGISHWIQTRDAWGFLLIQSVKALTDRQNTQGYLKFPMDVNFGIDRPTGGTAQLPIRSLQSGWPSEFLLTAREKPVNESESK